MKNITILMLALVFISCGKKQDKGGGIISRPPTGTGAIGLSELSAYKDSFLTRMVQAGVAMPYNNLVLTSDDISTSGVLGQCTIYRNSSNVIVERRITIDIPYWSTLTKEDREELMYHELAHCILLRGHTSTTTRISGVPDSMMHMYHMGPTLYNAQYAWYLNELFDDYPGTTLTVFNGATFNGTAYASTLASSYSVEQSETLRSEIALSHDNCIHEVIDVQ